MKLNRFFVAALAATTLFASCTKDQGGNGDNSANAGENAKLTIKLVSDQSTPGSRATGSNVIDDDKAIKEYVAIAVGKNDVIMGSVASSSHTDAVLETTTAATRVLVISNLNGALVDPGTSKLYSTITNVGKLALEIEAAIDLSKTDNTATLTNVANSVWSAGEEAVTWPDEPSGDAYKTDITVNIRPVAAKINLTVKLDSKYNAWDITIPGDIDPVTHGKKGNFRFEGTDAGVLLLNAVSKTKFFGAKAFETYTDVAYPWLVPSPKAYYSGMDISSPEFVNNHLTEPKPFLKNAFTDHTKVTTSYHYYIFENDADKAADFPTIVTLKGTWGMDLDVENEEHFLGTFAAGEKEAIAAALAPRDVYFPIHMTSLDAGAYFTPGDETFYGKGVQRGKRYDVTIELSDKMFTGDYEFPSLPITKPIVPPVVPPGTEDPTGEIVKGILNVTVTVEDWVPMNIEKVW